MTLRLGQYVPHEATSLRSLPDPYKRLKGLSIGHR